jgi:3-oxoadipate enol-lactonase
MPKVKINDINLYYEIHGQGEPLVLISGFSADHLLWGFVLEYLTPYYQVLVFDNRGAGQTDVPEGPYSIEQMAQDIEALCQHVGFENAHFVGNSMGGYLVQMIAYHYPSLVKSVVISNSAMITHSCFHIYAAAQLELLKLNASPEALIKASCAWAFSYNFLSQSNQLDNLMQLRLSNPYPFTIRGYEGQYAALDGFDSRSWANKIAVPTLVISSDQDIILPASLAQELLYKISGAQHYCFENCGHLPYVESPEKFSSVIKEFFTQNT